MAVGAFAAAAVGVVVVFESVVTAAALVQVEAVSRHLPVVGLDLPCPLPRFAEVAVSCESLV